MILVRMNHLELTTESNRSKLSIIRFCETVSTHQTDERPVSAYLTALLEQDLVVLAQSYAKDDGCDVFEAVNPLLPFASLAAHVEHAGDS